MPVWYKESFFISSVPYDMERGHHASITSSFLYVMVKGTWVVELDDGFLKEKHLLAEGESLYFTKFVWMRIFDFSRDSVLCVLSDNEYNKTDYISDYNE